MALPEWPCALGLPPISAQLKANPSDFFVEEQLGFELSGAGEFCLVFIEKENLNTLEVAQKLARFAGLRERDVAYSGMKDKQALTRQWFGLHLLNREIDWTRWNEPLVRILNSGRHHRKLRRGTHRSNRFDIVLREVEGDMAAFALRAAAIAKQGVPNYFGEQRFGRGGRNIEAARLWAARGRPRITRHQTGLHLSSVRAFLFNEVLAERVREGCWSTGLEGDVLMLNGSQSVFSEPLDTTLRARLQSGDVHPTCPLPGLPGALAPSSDAAALEARVLAQHPDLVALLTACDVASARRTARVVPSDWQCEVPAQGTVRLQFQLPTGCFATSLVRELALLKRSDPTIGAQE